MRCCSEGGRDTGHAKSKKSSSLGGKGQHNKRKSKTFQCVDGQMNVLAKTEMGLEDTIKLLKEKKGQSESIQKKKKWRKQTKEI